jgi:LysM repeat protein
MKTRTDIKSGASCYTVQSGDSLAKISQKYYGNQSQRTLQDLLPNRQPSARTQLDLRPRLHPRPPSH